MSTALLQAAQEQAERSDPAVRAAALMRVARVASRSDQNAAEEMLARGIGLAKELDQPGTEYLLKNAVYLAAAVSPKQALPLYAEQRRIDPFGGEVTGLVNAMATHGHLREAIAYLNDPLPGDRFPLDFLGNLATECHDDESGGELLAAAIRAWRDRDSDARSRHGPFAGGAFKMVFARFWKLVPREMAASVLRELVQDAAGRKSGRFSFPFMADPGGPDLGSWEERDLFELLPAIQELDPELARSVEKRHPRVAAAMLRFPRGMQSWRESGPKFDLTRDDAMMIGDGTIVPMPEALANDFQAAFREAYDHLADDSDSEHPNEVPKECWPSAHEFRNILYKAGQHLGLDAEKYLDRIPDADLRLLAQIELCAALAGLPQISYVTARQTAQSRESALAGMEQMFGPVLPGIRCPRCKWIPHAKNVWGCKCGHEWNTFDTRGLCPGCGYQWDSTACLQCGVMSPHKEWYVAK